MDNSEYKETNPENNVNKENGTSEENCKELDLEKIKIQLQNINIIREELIKLDLNPKQKLYYETEIIPLVTTLDLLASSSEHLSVSVQELFTTNISKNSKLKDTVELVYDINKSCEKVYEALKCKLKVLINIDKECK